MQAECFKKILSGSKKQWLAKNIFSANDFYLQATIYDLEEVEYLNERTISIIFKLIEFENIGCLFYQKVVAII